MNWGSHSGFDKMAMIRCLDFMDPYFIEHLLCGQALDLHTSRESNRKTNPSILMDVTLLV